MSACLSVYLSAYLLACLPACFFVYLPTCLPTCLLILCYLLVDDSGVFTFNHASVNTSPVICCVTPCYLLLLLLLLTPAAAAAAPPTHRGPAASITPITGRTFVARPITPLPPSPPLLCLAGRRGNGQQGVTCTHTHARTHTHTDTHSTKIIIMIRNTKSTNI